MNNHISRNYRFANINGRRIYLVVLESDAVSGKFAIFQGSPYIDGDEVTERQGLYPTREAAIEAMWAL